MTVLKMKDRGLLGRLKIMKRDLLETAAMGSSLTLAQLLMNLSPTLIAIFVAQIGQSELAGIGLANALANLTCWGTTAGLCSAAETLFSQAYGSPNKRQVGLDFQRTVIFVLIGFVIATAINMNCDLLFIVLGQDPVLACIAKRFLLVATPGYLCFFLARLLVSYLRVLDVYWPVIAGPLSGCCTMSVLSYLLLGYGLDGVAMAQNFGYLTMALVCVVYIFWSKIYQRTWQRVSLRMFDSWYQLTKLGLAGIILSMSEFFFLELMTLLAGTMGETSLAAQTINYQIFQVIYAFAFGLGGAGAIRVGYFLGANQPHKARYQVFLTLAVALIVQILVDAIVFAFRQQLVDIFTSDEEVIDLVKTLVLIMLGQQILQAVYMVFLGGMKGAGRQVIGSLTNIICMYLIGAPILIGTVFELGWGIVECWAILTGTYALAAIVFIILILTTDFEDESSKVQERVGLVQDSEPRKFYRTGAERDYSQLEMDDETKIVVPAKEEKYRRSFSEIVGQTTSQASRLNLAVSRDIPSGNLRLVAIRRVALIIFLTLLCSGLVGTNLTGLTSVETVFGPMHTFINSTTVNSCAYLIR